MSAWALFSGVRALDDSREIWGEGTEETKDVDRALNEKKKIKGVKHEFFQRDDSVEK